MRKPKPKQGKNKARDRKGRTPTGRPRRDWARIRREWYQSELSLEAFLRAHKIPKPTGQRHLSVKDKNTYLEETVEAGEKWRKRLADLAAKDDTRLYISSLKQFTAAASEILLDSSQDFKVSGLPMSKEKAGRLALSAGEILLKVTGELQGIPDEDEIDGWPLTRCFSPFRYQRDFIHDTPKSIRLEEGLDSSGSEDPFVFAFIGGRGAGKTHVGAQKAGQLAWLNRGKNGLVLAPTYPMLRDAAKAAFLKASSDKGLTYRHLKTENAVILFGDTKVYFRSMDDPDKIRGLNVAWAWLDEPGQLSVREAYDVVNGCIRGDDLPEPAILITTTPDGLNWLYEILVTEAEENHVRIYRARTRDNPLLGDFEARLRKSYDTRFAQQELDAEFIELFKGMAYWQFSSVDSIFEPGEIDINDGLPLDLCCDFNVSPMCWNVSQDFTVNGDTYTYVFDEIHLDTAGTDVTVKEFIERYGETKSARRAGVRVWGDATGQARATSATRSDFKIIIEALKAAEIPAEQHIGRSNPRQRDRVLSVNARLLAGDDVRRFFVSKRCKYTIIDFQRTAFIPGTQQLDKGQTRAGSRGGKKRKATLTHHTDALGYKIYRSWPVRGPHIEQVAA